MSYHIEKKEAMRIVGIRTPLVEDMEENRQNVPEFWRRTLERTEFLNICDLSTAQPKGILGITVCENPQNRCKKENGSLDCRFRIGAI